MNTSPEPPSRRISSPAGLFLAVTVLAILVICLHPTGGGNQGVIRTCMVCGYRGTSNLLLNVLLYAPLGVAMRWNGASLRATVMAGFLLSFGVEVAQLWIPGRFTGINDLSSNVLGAALGGLSPSSARSLLVPEPARAKALAAAAASGAALALVATTLLLAPSVPRGELFASLTPELATLQEYDGRVLRAEIDGTSLDPGALGQARALRSRLEAPFDLGLAVRVGTPPDGLAPLLHVAAGRDADALILGVDGEDGVVVPRLLAEDLWLAAPDLTAPGLFAGTRVGDTVEVRLSAFEDGTYRLSAGGRSSTSLGFTLARGWSILRHGRGLPPGVYALLDVVWLSLLFFPIGLWARGRTVAVLSGGLPLVVMALGPAATSLLPTPAPHYVAACAALLSGWAVRGLADRARRPSSGPGATS